MSSNTVAVVPPSVVVTTAEDGTTRFWGACDQCGHVEEIGAKRVEAWQASPLCGGCEGDYCDITDAASVQWLREQHKRSR